MAKKNITMDDLMEFIDNLPYNQFKQVVDRYASVTKSDFQKEMDSMVTASLQQKLLKLGINSCHNVIL